MKKAILFLLFTILSFTSGFGQNLWNKVSSERLIHANKMDRASMPAKYELFSLDFQTFKSQLRQAPLDTSGIQSDLVISFPNAEGKLDKYLIYEAPVMEPGLEAKFPDIKSYLGKGIDDPTATIRFSVTLFGLHTMTLSGRTGTTFIDTYTKDLSHYMVYSKSDIAPSKQFQCLVDDSQKPQLDNSNKVVPNPVMHASDGKFRIFRLAMACTIEYAAYHVNAAGLGAGTLAQKKAAVLAAMVVTVTRVDGVYERDLSMRMNLVANNDLVIFITSDNFNNTNANTLINQSQTQITNIIGDANFDIGHTVSTGGGGLAGPSPCVTGAKARGITGSSAPVGDPYDIDYVAHEMGHQFGANHTFNGDTGSCAGNRNDGTAVEPGSGSTIMAYAGICPGQNVQPNSDAHFHSVSIQEINNLIATSATCAATTNNGNSAPVVNAGMDYVIPRSTAFILNGSATDANGDALTYCWEQTDTEVSVQPPVDSSTGGPNFRSNPPTASSERSLPNLATVLAGNTANTWEVCSSVAREYNFSLTVRDNRSPNGGQTGRDDMSVTVDGVAGPFLVNVPNTNVSWAAGTNQTVTWAVAGTDANGVNAKFVDIYLSTNGGTSFPTLLASKVPNDGSETITVPNTPGTTNRIMIKGYNNIFYDLSNTNFTITAPAATFAVSFAGTAGEQNKSACQGTNVSYSIPYTVLGGFSGTTTFSATGNPAGSSVAFAPSSVSANGTVVMTISNTAASTAGLYAITVNATSGPTTKTVPLYFELFNSNFGTMALTSPANLAVSQDVDLNLTWAANPNATSYDVQVATDNAFSAIVRSGNVSGTSFAVSGLSQGTSYFWRVLPKNVACSGTYSPSYKFTTGSIACNTTASTNVPLTIGTTANVTINSTLTFPSNVTISDVKVTMNVSHTWINDLTATLISPAGTQVKLYALPCTSADIQNVNATFDNAGTAVVCGTNPGISGTVLPLESLAAFDGQNSAGVWTLRINDGFAQDGGTLNSWSLNICSVQPLSVDENSLQDFSLYPNPNNGDFVVKFTSASNNDIKVNVHDMRGRKVYDKSFANTGAFNQNISLDNVQSGIYLVTITDGPKRTVKRIVVQ
ncbi:reprolysin-like metallopeptidase [Flavobacterium humi]|uniref:T9SS type A sorting domain-containing protein n=1 Tax=Flavobacterium humi TaxID=2562683 RepID=A0A4Z0L752_9FLAO|nr:zinc-dependent metalloprotease family protein [Flavobacterium humi]TGD57609.1 T9SS type A sorting domain-containing protein [Flavobacterium humi]